MGKNYNSSRLVNGLSVDASGNVGVGGSPSGSYKFQVTGTGNFTGALRTASTFTSGDTIQLGLASTDGGFWTWGGSFSYLVGASGKGININPNGASGTTGLSIATNGDTTFSRNIVMSGTNAQLLQTTANSVAGDNVMVLYNSNANSYGLYIGAGSGTNHALYITDSTRTANLFKVQGNGNVGIGTGSPDSLLHIFDSASGSNKTYIKFTCGDGGHIRVGKNDGVSNDAVFGTWSNNQTIFYSNSTERMRITSAGVVLINKTSADAVSGGGSLQVGKEIFSLGSSAFLGFEDRTNGTYKYGWYATGNTIVYFYSSVNGNLATINPSTGAYTALSDINKKKDFEESTIGLNAILGLKPTLFRMNNEDESIEKQLGFIAQEVKEFIPQAYVETGEGEDKFIGLTDRPIIAALVKAIQELKAENDDLRSILNRNNLQ